MNESVDTVTITVNGFAVTSFGFDEEEITIAAEEICQDIGMALSQLGTSSQHGIVTVEVGGLSGSCGCLLEPKR